jgi:inosine-uridine nucleoside N-ribohydrolase
MWIDSDVANEIDDPFAIAHALLSPDQIHVEGITLAPFRRDGLSVPESIRVSRALSEETLAHIPERYRAGLKLVDGSNRFLEAPDDAVDSDAVQSLLDASKRSDHHLHIVAIGAATNVASALIMDPSLVQRCTVWWLAGHAMDLSAWEYNLMGDPHASRVLLNSGVPLVLFPALGVTSHLLVSLAALERDIDGTSSLGTFLTDLLRTHVPDHFGYEKELWDVAVPAYAIQPDWVQSTLEPTPGVSEDLRWTRRAEAVPYRRVHYVNRNGMLRDLFEKVRSL